MAGNPAAAQASLRGWGLVLIILYWISRLVSDAQTRQTLVIGFWPVELQAYPCVLIIVPSQNLVKMSCPQPYTVLVWKDPPNLCTRIQRPCFSFGHRLSGHHEIYLGCLCGLWGHAGRLLWGCVVGRGAWLAYDWAYAYRMALEGSCWPI